MVLGFIPHPQLTVTKSHNQDFFAFLGWGVSMCGQVPY